MEFMFVCFSCLLLLDFRTSGGRLHLIQDVGKIPLADATLIEEPNDSDKEDESTKSYKSILFFFSWE